MQFRLAMILALASAQALAGPRFDVPVRTVTVSGHGQGRSDDSGLICTWFRAFMVKEIGVGIGSEQKIVPGSDTLGVPCEASPLPGEYALDFGATSTVFLGARGSLAFFADPDPLGMGTAVYLVRLPARQPFFHDQMRLPSGRGQGVALNGVQLSEQATVLEYDRVVRLECSLDKPETCESAWHGITGTPFPAQLCQDAYEREASYRARSRCQDTPETARAVCTQQELAKQRAMLGDDTPELAYRVRATLGPSGAVVALASGARAGVAIDCAAAP